MAYKRDKAEGLKNDVFLGEDKTITSKNSHAAVSVAVKERIQSNDHSVPTKVLATTRYMNEKMT